MTRERAIELLRNLMDRMINEDGGHSKDTIARLFNAGFTCDELIDDFGWSFSDIDDAWEAYGMDECE